MITATQPISRRPVFLLFIGVIVHIVFFLSIFDVYFRSPVDESLLESADNNDNNTTTSKKPNPIANRVVLIVADGLRADVCFSFMGRDTRFRTIDDTDAHVQAAGMMWPRAKESFLRHVVEKLGAWGVAHTRVPTETRPGHVALVGGMYEDVSAVTRGWQANPVPFDHVFRNARHTYAWGHEDVTGLFARDQVSKSKITQSFPPHQEDFGDKNLSSMDVWVFNRVNEFLSNSPNSPSKLSPSHPNASELVFFLHLGALDANGHAFRPHSHEYFDNMALVDRGVAGIYHLFESAFNHDGKTAYIFSSDHGMSARGAHGDGHPDNTRTPFVAWGAGIAGPTRKVSNKTPHSLMLDGTYTRQQEEGFIEQWGLAHLWRRDLEQADVAPLISTLLNIKVPAHSVGLLPLAYLHPGPTRARAILRNVKQLLAQVKSKELSRKTHTLSVRFHASRDLARAELLFEEATNKLHSSLVTGESKVQQLDLDYVETLCVEIATLCRAAMRHHQIYDRPLLMGSVTMGYVGFMLLASEAVFAAQSNAWPATTTSSPYMDLLLRIYEWVVICGAVVMLTSVALVLVLEKAPILHHMYPIAALSLWVMLLTNTFNGSLSLARIHMLTSITKNIPLMCFVWMETQMLVAGYSFRICLSVLMILEGARPFAFVDSFAEVNNRMPLLKWAMGCMLLAVFTFMDVDSSPNIYTMSASGLCAIGAIAYQSSSKGRGVLYWASIKSLVFGNPIWLACIALLVSVMTDISMAQSTHGEKLGWQWQLLAWVVFLSSPICCRMYYVSLLKLHDDDEKQSASSVLSLAFWTLIPQYVLLAVNYEVLFLTSLYVLLVLWQQRRTINSSTGATTVAPDYFGLASTFLVVSNVAFFATGNFASMSSFHLSSTFRFSSVYNPFLMAVLLIYKVMIPYLLVTVAVVEIFSLGPVDVASPRKAKQTAGEDRTVLFLIVIGMCDCMAITLFFMVRDEGSWLEIGNTISQYGFACAHLIFMPIMFVACAKWMQWVSN